MQQELPLGFMMALAKNENAMKKFENLTQDEKNAVLEKTHLVSSKHEMEQLVSDISSIN